MEKVQIIFIMFIYLNLRGLPPVLNANEDYHLSGRDILFRHSIGDGKSLEKTERITTEKFPFRSDVEKKYLQKEISTAEPNGIGGDTVANENKFTFAENSIRNDNVYTSKFEKIREDGNANRETFTTEFNLISSDFKAKDNRENSLKSPSLSNVPQKSGNKFNKSSDLDQPSFINNNIINNNSSSHINKTRFYRKSQKRSETGEVKEELDEKNSISLQNSDYLFKKKKDFIAEVIDFGLRQMHELYEVKEKEIYDAGVFLPKSSPGSYLAAFNQQSSEIKKISRFGYAALKAAGRLKEELADSKLRQEIFNVTEGSSKSFPEISLLDTSLHDSCPLKNNPRCPPWKHLYRTADGTCNNLKNPWWGAKLQPLKRFLAPHYSDGLESVRESVRGGPLPSPRFISTEIHWEKNVNSKSVTHMLMQWGQFIDHDMTSSSQSRGFNGSVPRCCNAPLNLQHPDCLPIEVPSNDRFFSRFGIRCLEFLRSAPFTGADCALGPREQVNQVTSYIDGSMIYGNSDREASKLRLFRNGMLKYSRMPQRLPLLPLDSDRGEFCRNSNADFFCLLSGDSRMNEQPGLIAMHIVFLRLHNRLTRNLAHLNPDWSDERLYQETRKIVGAILQHITFKEFLPIVLGQDVMTVFELELLKEGFYNGYNDQISATAANAFSTAAYRFGHSMVQGKFLRWDDVRKEAIANVSLHEELQDPATFHRIGAVDSLMLGMCIQEAQKRDEHFSAELTNHLFETPRFPAGLDLAAINIQRGRDHGLPSYNSWRNPCGLKKIRTWNDLLHVMPEETRDGFRRVYRDVNDIDLFPGGLSEFPVRGGIVGSTFACIIAQHFRNMRKGDRFWYENEGFENSFTPSQLKSIRRITLARILCDNLDLIEKIQPFVFLTEDNLRNKKVSCRSGEIPFIDLNPWDESPKGKMNQKFQGSVGIPLPEMPKPESEPIGNEIPKPFS